MNSDDLDLPGSQVKVQLATWRDLSALRRMEGACFPQDAWPLLDLVGVLTLPNIVRLKAVAGEEMVGFVAGDLRSRQDQAWIATIGVLPEYRRRGIGMMLLKACEERLHTPSVRLCVRPSNLGAIQLYKTAGYQQAGIWEKYYQDGENALVMEKALGG